VAIITARDAAGRLYGLTANSFSSVSLSPPLVLWSLGRRQPSMAAFDRATHFGVNVLSTEQRELAERFARAQRDKFDGVSYEVGPYGVPLIAGAAAQFECRIVGRYEGGDHEIFLGQVERYSYEHKPTLLFCHGTYQRAEPLDDPAR
jgi:flavin reductase (DIM6/NTAB) family NADH-FMN oxidoreductase RutF